MISELTSRRHISGTRARINQKKKKIKIQKMFLTFRNVWVDIYLKRVVTSQWFTRFFEYAYLRLLAVSYFPLNVLKTQY